jgi:hypothetical protein
MFCNTIIVLDPQDPQELDQDPLDLFMTKCFILNVYLRSLFRISRSPAESPSPIVQGLDISIDHKWPYHHIGSKNTQLFTVKNILMLEVFS